MGTPSELVVKDRRRFDADGERRPEVEPYVPDPADEEPAVFGAGLSQPRPPMPGRAAHIAALLASVGGVNLDAAIADAVREGGTHDQIATRVAEVMADAAPWPPRTMSRENRRRLKQLRAGRLRGVAKDEAAQQVADAGTLERLAAYRERVWAAEDEGAQP